MISERYRRWPRSSVLLRAIATSRPKRKVIATTPPAKAKFQTRIFRNDERITELVTTAVKLRSPTLTFQPWARFWPELSLKKPLVLSAVKVLPVLASLMQSQALS